LLFNYLERRYESLETDEQAGIHISVRRRGDRGARSCADE
jgi:hypothetical protein